LVNVAKFKAIKHTAIAVRNIKLFCMKTKSKNKERLLYTLVIITKTKIKEKRVVISLQNIKDFQISV
jgi:hypothetical protein